VEHSHLGVRRLLRKLRYPDLLERDHYALAVRDAVGGVTAREALTGLLDEVLHRYPPVYRTIIKRIDVDGEPARTVAGELYLSYRTLHRYRTTAIAAIAEALERRFGVAGSAADRFEAEAGVNALVAEGFRHLRRHSLRSMEAAGRCFTRALELDETCADAWIGLASCHEQQALSLERDAVASFDAAAHALDRAAKLAPERAEVYEALHRFAGRDHASSGRWTGAEERVCTARLLRDGHSSPARIAAAGAAR
jgi:tetratricopeptide (TPR) repeat protein